MQGDLVSKFGEYSGYTKPMYEEWVRSSHYLEMEDGVKLAADIVRPAQLGDAVDLPMPTIWAYYRYHRAREKDGRVLSLVDRLTDLQTLVKHGYVVVVVDARGTGASFGCEDKGPNSPRVGRDVYTITEWIAGQPWCDGNVGMFGHSYSANTQIVRAAVSPPHLKAIFPSMAGFDLYRVMYPGGVFSEVMVRAISQGLRKWDIEMEAVPVDEDPEGAHARAARREHQDNADAFEFLSSYPFRNTEVDDLVFWIERNLCTHLPAVNGSGIPVYLWAGWHDFLVRGSFLWYANLTVAKKLAVGPWSHGSHDWYDILAVEELRWFDYWLKGVQNGILDELPINFAIEHNDSTSTWHKLAVWPPPETQVLACYLGPGPSRSVESINDGVLGYEHPAEDTGGDTYVLDYTCSSDLDDMTANDEKGLTYTTAPLERDLTLVGHPVMRLHISASAEDLDLFAYLENVDKEGVSRHMSDGVLRASHRAQAEPPFDNLGLPYHRHFEEDVSRMPSDSVVELAFDLQPVSAVIPAGHRIRLTITCADRSHAEPTEKNPIPTIRLHRNRRYPSCVELPALRDPSSVPKMK